MWPIAPNHPLAVHAHPPPASTPACGACFTLTHPLTHPPQGIVTEMYQQIRDEAKRDAAKWNNPGDVDRGYQCVGLWGRGWGRGWALKGHL